MPDPSRRAIARRKLRVGKSFLFGMVILPLAFLLYLSSLTMPGHESETNQQQQQQYRERELGLSTKSSEKNSSQQHALLLPEIWNDPNRLSHTQATLYSSSSVSPFLWHKNSSSLPSWAKEYMDWYHLQRDQLSDDNWASHRYLILQCLMEDPHCGGVSDRLKPLPLLLWMAHQSQRLFMIRWTRPCALEEFLVPPQHGYNWTVPWWLGKHFSRTTGKHNNNVSSYLRTHLPALQRDVRKKDIAILRARMQVFDGGSSYFDTLTNNMNHQSNGTPSSLPNETYSTYSSMYHDLFRTFFEPSPPIRTILDKTQRLHPNTLLPGTYATAHYRAHYGKHEDQQQNVTTLDSNNKNNKKEHDDDLVATLAVNAVKCASQLRPGGPVYFTSDSKQALDAVREYARHAMVMDTPNSTTTTTTSATADQPPQQQHDNRTTQTKNIVVMENQQPIHLDKATITTTSLQQDDAMVRPAVAPSLFYSVFVDLWLLGNGQCGSYGQGGFGRFGLLLSYNASCSIRHVWKQRDMRRCQWTPSAVVSY